MVLEEEDYHLYVTTHIDLLYYVGQVQELIPAAMTLKAFYKTPFQKKFLCRDELYKNMHLLDDYIDKQKEQLDAELISILQGFKKKIQSDFIILKCLTKHCIFIDCKTNLVYTVKALSDPFDEFFPRFPAYFSTTLLPYRNMIIYDGFISMRAHVSLGAGMSADMNEIYKKAKENHTIITTLQ